MDKKAEDLVSAFDELADAGNGVIAIPPKNEHERKVIHQQMINYLSKRDSDKLKAK